MARLATYEALTSDGRAEFSPMEIRMLAHRSPTGGKTHQDNTLGGDSWLRQPALVDAVSRVVMAKQLDRALT
jgi:hypothetical protein